MATKIIDVSLASMENTGETSVSPKGTILCQVVRSVDDEQVFQSELLYSRESGQPMHPSGATNIPPGQSLTFNTTQRLTVSFFDKESEGQLNQMLIIKQNLRQQFVVSGSVKEVFYFGRHRGVRFQEMEGFQTIFLPYNAFTDGVEARFLAAYTVNVVSSSG